MKRHEVRGLFRPSNLYGIYKTSVPLDFWLSRFINLDVGVFILPTVQIQSKKLFGLIWLFPKIGGTPPKMDGL